MEHEKKRKVDPEHKIKMVIMRGMGYSQSDIAKEFGVTRSAISKQFERLRNKCKNSWGKVDYEGNILREFFNLMLYSKDMDYSSIISLGNKKYLYESLVYQGMARSQALKYSLSEDAVIRNPPWIMNPDFDGSVLYAKKKLFQPQQKTAGRRV